MSMKAHSLTGKILQGVAIGGAVLLSAANPYFGLRLIKGFKRWHSKAEWRKFHASLRYLDRRGYVKIISHNRGSVRASITKLGEWVVKSIDIDAMKLIEPRVWDGKWRVVIFDVPVNKSGCRQALTEKLKELGFIMVQRSVWAYPYECRDEISILRAFYGIQRFVVYLEVNEVEDELDWRGKFNLKQK